MALSEDFLYQLKLNNDIVSVMSSYVNMKKSSRNFVCLCPFHSEKTPSCHIYTESQSFYCFGCGAGGDVITFIRMIENLDYIESVRFLAQRSGMTMPEDKNDEGAMRRTRLLEMNREAGRFFHNALYSPIGKAGLDYITNRGLTEKTIKKFGIGFAPDDWHTLHQHMRGLGFGDAELADAALLGRNNNRYYDKFRNRVMFPIIDRRGNIIAFGGRALEKDAVAKYLNSDETLVFHKRDNLYNLNYAKNSKARFFILCEGYMDVISVYQAGFHSSVATLGTAITPEQARLLRHYTEEVVIAYDSDGAGQAASVKAINLLGEAGINARVIDMKDCKDPDEFIGKYGAEAFSLILEKAGAAIEFELKKLMKSVDMDTTEGKSAFLKKAVVLLAGIQNRLDRAVHISQVAKLTEISTANVEQGVNYEISRRQKKSAVQERKQLVSAVPARDKINPEADKFPAEAKAERGIIAFLFKSPDKLGKIMEKLDFDDFPTSFHKRVAKSLESLLKNGQNPDLSALGEEFSTEEMGKITAIINEFREFPTDMETLDDYISTILRHKDGQNSKKAADMDADDLLRLAQEIARKKK